MSEHTLSKATPWYYVPSVIIVAGCLVAMINFGVRSSFGLFTGPISEANAWPREVYSLAMALQNLLLGVATPFAGAFADRYGSARVLIAGAVFYAIGTALMAGATSPAMLYFSGGLLIGIGIAASSFGIVMAAFGRLVPPEKRSWAFGIATAASSMGQFVFAPLGGALIPAFGWYQALLILAACSLLIIVFALPLMAQNTSKSAVPSGEAELSMREAIRAAFGNRSYNLLTAGFFVCGFQLAFITIHLPPYLQSTASALDLPALRWAPSAFSTSSAPIRPGSSAADYSKRIPLEHDLSSALRRHRRLHSPADHRCDDADLHRIDGSSVAFDRAADHGPRHRDVRHPLHGDALRLRVSEPPGRIVLRRLAGRPAL